MKILRTVTRLPLFEYKLKKMVPLGIIAIFSIGLSAQNNCSKYYPMKEGSTFEYTIYNKKGKLDGISSYSITGIKSSGNETSATFHIDFKNSKGGKEFDTDYDITCTGSGIKIDYMSLMPSEMMSQYKDMDVEMDFSGTDIEIPNDLNVGQELSNANVTMKMSMAGINMNISVDIMNRRVESKESITTPAGTFDCYQLSETVKSKTLGASIELLSKTWLAEGVGVIKNETFKKNGQSQGSTVLSKLDN